MVLTWGPESPPSPPKAAKSQFNPRRSTIKRHGRAFLSNTTARDPSQDISSPGINQFRRAPEPTLIELSISGTIAGLTIPLFRFSISSIPFEPLRSWSPDLHPDIAVSSCDIGKWIKSRRPSNPCLYFILLRTTS